MIDRKKMVGCEHPDSYAIRTFGKRIKNPHKLFLILFFSSLFLLFYFLRWHVIPVSQMFILCFSFFVLDKVELKRKRLKTGNDLNLFDISPNDGRKFSFSYFIIFIYFVYYTYYFVW